MVTDLSSSQTSKSLPIPVPRLIAFRFVTIEPTIDSSQTFSWLSFEGASSYIVQLKNSKGMVFRDRVLATNKQKETYSYEETLLQLGEDYLFTVEIDLHSSCLDYCHMNNEKNIAEYVAQGISNIKSLESFSQLTVTLLTQLDALLIARDEILNIIWGLTRQGSNSEIICFLNYFLAQGSALQLLANSSSSDDILEAISEIASQLAAAYITLSKYLHLSDVQTSLVESLAVKSAEFAFSSQNSQGNFQFKKFVIRRAFSRSSSSVCSSFLCRDLPKRMSCEDYHHICGNCSRCDG